MNSEKVVGSEKKKTDASAVPGSYGAQRMGAFCDDISVGRWIDFFRGDAAVPFTQLNQQ
ncbi:MULTISPECIES: hypothetical protein [Franconibacter]|uniref:Uncharacterized protein n=1 Tax=Franconibacter daqui TaxID=2047724 RepID=A0ABV1PSG8_9ENTR|nr:MULTISPECIES: hypothetical protein [Franconibacter]MCK1967993.1 hypothetical protein [Franconibacter sp. IITDAS19]MEB5920537.1 hypothetical protein [Franconibacter daqui]GGD16079.1 hypothetical protein GCM10011513_11840 [Franconibacter daqui]